MNEYDVYCDICVYIYMYTMPTIVIRLMQKLWVGGTGFFMAS